MNLPLLAKSTDKCDIKNATKSFVSADKQTKTDDQAEVKSSQAPASASRALAALVAAGSTGGRIGGRALAGPVGPAKLEAGDDGEG